MATSTSSVYGASTNSSSTDKNWAEEAKNKIFNLSLSDNELISFITTEFNSKDASDSRRNLLLQFLNMRSSLATGLSNIIRTVGETARSVIGNFRS